MPDLQQLDVRQFLPDAKDTVKTKNIFINICQVNLKNNNTSMQVNVNALIYYSGGS